LSTKFLRLLVCDGIGFVDKLFNGAMFFHMPQSSLQNTAGDTAPKTVQSALFTRARFTSHLLLECRAYEARIMCATPARDAAPAACDTSDAFVACVSSIRIADVAHF
jgi:hypothetical protein